MEFWILKTGLFVDIHKYKGIDGPIDLLTHIYPKVYIYNQPLNS